jgi:cytochrome c
MEFLKDIAIPASLEHFRLLVLISTLSSIVFVPYVSFVLGSSILSLWFNHKRRIKENVVFLNLAHELVDTALYNKSLITFLAILPGLSLVLTYAQMLQKTSSLGVGLIGFGFLFLLAGMILLSVYKYTFRVQEMLGSYQQLLQKQSDRPSEETTIVHRETDTHSYFRAGKYGVCFLSIALILYSAAISVTSNPSSWDNDSVFSLFLSLDVWLKVIELLLLSTGMSGLGMLFFTFAWESRKEHSEEYALFVRKLGIRLSMTGLLTLPIFVLFNVAAVPDAALSGMVYSFTGSVIILFFLAAHFIYGYHKSLQPVAITVGFAMFMLATVILMTSDHVAVGTATRTHAVLLALNHEKSMEGLKSSLGVPEATFTGEDIYIARCYACHLFDQKKVGPPYIETIPKYRDKKGDLVAFILNPTKMNPAYPPMPNQGLRQAEADSIASYIMRKVAASFPKSMK